MSQVETPESVIITERAARRVAKILSAEPDGSLFRVAVNGGGCSGFSYEFEVGTAKGADDLVLEREGATFVIDPVSLEYLKGSRIDFVDNVIGQSFQIDNPNATSSCGCGTSFSL